MPFPVQSGNLIVQPFHQNFWAWLEFFYLWLQIMSMIKIQRFWDFWVLNVDLQVWKNNSSILSNTLQFTYTSSLKFPFLGGYFPNIKMGIYSEDLPGRREGEILKKNRSNHNHFEWWFQSDHDHQKSPKITIPNQMIADHQYPALDLLYSIERKSLFFSLKLPGNVLAATYNQVRLIVRNLWYMKFFCCI